MKPRKANSVVENGVFFGGEIEPGTFHAQNISKVSGNFSKMPAPEESVRQDVEIAADTPATEADVTF